MRKPEAPPPHDSRNYALLREPDQLIQGLTAIRHNPLVNGKYLHWDELRRRPKPAEMSHEDWWCLVKYVRIAMENPLPLQGINGNPFVYVVVPPIPESLRNIDLSAGGRIGVPDQIMNPETRDRYYVSSLIEEAITSSQLEGATTTHRVAEDMIRSGRDPRDKSERMILNNFNTMRRIGELKREPLTPEIVLELHRTVTDQTLGSADQAGRLRRSDEDYVVKNLERDEILHVPPPADQLPDRLKAMCAFANNEAMDEFLHPVLNAIILHFWLAYDHPFVDGNGRTARALFYWSMLKEGYWLFEFVSISRILKSAPAQYGLAFLHSETDGNDLTYFLLHQIGVINRAIEELNTYIEKKTQETRTLERKLKGVSQLNHRQRALIAHALRHPNHEYSIESHRMSHSIVYETARTDLLDLVRRGLLSVSKNGRTQYFTPILDLERKLRDA